MMNKGNLQNKRILSLAGDGSHNLLGLSDTNLNMQSTLLKTDAKLRGRR